MKKLLAVIFLSSLYGCTLCDIAPKLCEPAPAPTPTPTPTPEPTPEPPDCETTGCPEGQTCFHVILPGDPDDGKNVCLPTPTPTPEPTPTPTPTPSVCPFDLTDVYFYMRTNPYGQGLDSTVRIRGDKAAVICKEIHGVNTNDCHLEGLPPDVRVECEMELIGGCPVWQFRTATQPTPQQCVNNTNAEMSCDHFGNTVYRDDPLTPTVFEGQPLECGLQRNVYGPIAGFFTIAHGLGEVRACPASVQNDSVCGQWRAVDH